MGKKVLNICFFFLNLRSDPDSDPDPNLRTDLDETFLNDLAWAKDQLLRFWW